MRKMFDKAKEFVKDESGMNTLEYAALAFAILLTALGAARVLGNTTKTRFNKLDNEMSKTN